MKRLAVQRCACGARQPIPRQPRSFTTYQPRTIVPTAREAAERLVDAHALTVLTRRQQIDVNQLQKLSLTLNRPKINGIDVRNYPPPDGTPLPAGYHLVYFTPNGLESELGADGSDQIFNAGPEYPRRMWAGGEMFWTGEELRAGEVAEESTRLLRATPKRSKGGEYMLVVDVEKEIYGPRGLVVVDTRSWVFKQSLEWMPGWEKVERTVMPLKAETGPSMVEDEHSETGVTRNVRWSSVGLMRFSALTFNGHKIHHDTEWTRGVEGHPATVVHGPLNLINMLDYWRDFHSKGKTPQKVVYRAMAPVYAGERYKIFTQNDHMEEGRSEVLIQGGPTVRMRGIINGFV